ncbi:MAG: GspH/FimT family pseudopilin [Gammaproteobacteria bacterium]|jgi:type IV fimbrial biogenesis protein FimT
MQATNRGLTLLELLIAISIAAILIAIVIPPMQGMIAGARIAFAINGLASLMTYARSEAITRNRRITLCPTTDRKACAGAADWKHGAMVFADHNGNRRRDDDELLLKYRSTNGRLEIFSGSSPDESGRSRKRVVFSPSGSAAGYTISIRFCAPGNAAPARILLLQNSGRIRLSERESDGSRPDCGA